MEKMRLKNAAVQGAQLRAGFLFICFLLVFGQIKAQSPQIHWTDLDSFRIGYKLNTSETVLQANEHFSIKLYLQVMNPAFCSGVEMGLSHHPGVTPLDHSLHFPESSWLGPASEIYGEVIDNSHIDSLSLFVLRSNGAESGTGWIATVDFQVGDGSLPAAEVMETIGGNLIILDNLDMKKEPEVLAPGETQITLFPNPFTEWLTIQSSIQQTMNVKCFNLQGECVYQTTAETGSRISMESLQKGTYLIDVCTSSGQRLMTSRIIKQ